MHVPRPHGVPGRELAPVSRGQAAEGERTEAGAEADAAAAAAAATGCCFAAWRDVLLLLLLLLLLLQLRSQRLLIPHGHPQAIEPHAQLHASEVQTHDAEAEHVGDGVIVVSTAAAG